MSFQNINPSESETNDQKNISFDNKDGDNGVTGAAIAADIYRVKVNVNSDCESDKDEDDKEEDDDDVDNNDNEDDDAENKNDIEMENADISNDD